MINALGLRCVTRLYHTHLFWLYSSTKSHFYVSQSSRNSLLFEFSFPNRLCRCKNRKNISQTKTGKDATQAYDAQSARGIEGKQKLMRRVLTNSTTAWSSSPRQTTLQDLDTLVRRTKHIPQSLEYVIVITYLCSVASVAIQFHFMSVNDKSYEL